MSLIGKTGVLAVGYLAGSRAGRHRYDQLAGAAAAWTARPQVRDACSRATNGLLRRWLTPLGEVPGRAHPPEPARSPAHPSGTGSTPPAAGPIAGSDLGAVPAGDVAPPAGWTSARRLRRRTF